jgi:Dolichyl-phosphate-mannose-protein mannosyltransferase
VSAWLGTIGVCAAIAGVGWPWSATLPRERLPLAGRLGLAYLAGVALTTQGLLLTTLIGLDVGRPALALVAIVLLAGGMLLVRGPTFPQTPIVPGSYRFAAPFLILAGAALTLGVVDAVRFGSPTHIDFLNAWGVKGKVAFVDRNLDFSRLGHRWLYYPLNVSNLYTSVFVVQGSADESLLRVPGALFGVALAGVVWGFGRRLLSPAPAAACVALVVVTPAYVHSMNLALADLPLAAYVTICGVAAYLWVVEGGTGWASLSGFSAGAAAWTKVEGLPLVLVIGVTAVVLARHRSRRPMLHWLGWLAFFTVPWQLFMRLHGIPPSSTHFTIRHTDIGIILEYVARQLASVSSWGLFWWICAAVIAGTFPVWRHTPTRLLAALILPNVVLSMSAWLTTQHPCVPCSIEGIGNRIYLHAMPGAALLTVVAAMDAAAALRASPGEDASPASAQPHGRP